MLHFFSRMRLKWYYFLQMSFHLVLRFFGWKSEKNRKLEKIRKYDEETEYFETKLLHASKSNF